MLTRMLRPLSMLLFATLAAPVLADDCSAAALNTAQRPASILVIRSAKPLPYDEKKWSDRFQLLTPFKIRARVTGEGAPYPSCILAGISLGSGRSRHSASGGGRGGRGPRGAGPSVEARFVLDGGRARPTRHWKVISAALDPRRAVRLTIDLLGFCKCLI